MRRDFLDRYSRLASPIHRAPAGLKLLLALILVIATVLVAMSQTLWFAGVAFILLVVAAYSRVPPSFLVKRMVLLEPFVLGVALLAIFQPNGGKVFTSIVIKSSLCLFTMVLLSNTTPFAELLRVLKRIGLPAILVTTLALMYRYLFVLMDETERLQRARKCRSFHRDRARAWQSLGMVIGQLFVRSTERAERIYAAMCARGWK